MAENWVMVVSEMHRYQGVSYKSDIIVISGNVIIGVIIIIYHHHQVLILEIGKCLNRNTVAANPHASWTLRMGGIFRLYHCRAMIALCLLRGTDSYLDFSCHSCSGTPM